MALCDPEPPVRSEAPVLPVLPVTLLGGYLGAGKTTLLNRLLTTSTHRVAVVVNDVGAIGVDAALVADHDGATLTLTNGCICCALGDDLAMTLHDLRSLTSAAPPEAVVVELSGVGEPARVAPHVLAAGCRLDGIVVVADVEAIVEQTERRYVGDTVRSQLAAADLVVLSKTDLCDDGGAAARSFVIATAGPRADGRHVVVVDGTRLDPGSLLGIGTPTTPRPEGAPVPPHLVSVVDIVGLDRAAMLAVLEELPAGTVRAKGLVHCVGEEAPVEVHVVGRRREVRVRTDLAGRPTDDRLVVIGEPAPPSM